MINLYPGPSKLHPSVSKSLLKVNELITYNHRSPEFMDLYKKTQLSLFKKLSIPQDYTLCFVSSATECWEIIAESYNGLSSLHIYNGNFGRKWYEITKKLGGDAREGKFEINDLPSLTENADLLCFTHCETSNGTYIPSKTFTLAKEKYPESLIAIDSTASLGAIHIDFEKTDIVFSSVQKCLGLPAGLGLLILSPRAIEITKNLNRNNHYNSICNLSLNAKKYQTTYTPNILGIYLLSTLLEKYGDSQSNEKILRKRQKHLIQKHKIELVSQNTKVSSPTVLAIKNNQPQDFICQKAQRGIIVGKGYGDWKSSSYRIANFPAHTLAELNKVFEKLNLT